MTFPAPSVVFWRKMDDRILLYWSFNEAEQWCDVTFYSVSLPLRQNLVCIDSIVTPFDILYKIDDRKAY